MPYPAKKMRKKYGLILRELKVAKDLLNSGITTIGNANQEHMGLYYSAFTDLSQGLERLMKVIIILRFISERNKLPTKKEIQSFSHNLEALYKECVNFGLKLNIVDGLGDREVITKMINVLDKFASDPDNGRYYNYSMIFCGDKPLDKMPDDCIMDWSLEVDEFLIKRHVCKRTKEKFHSMADSIVPIIDKYSIIKMDGELGPVIGPHVFVDGNTRYLLSNQLRMFFLAKLVRYLSRILSAQTNVIRGLDPEVPHYEEVFRYYLIEDKYLRRKRRYNY